MSRTRRKLRFLEEKQFKSCAVAHNYRVVYSHLLRVEFVLSFVEPNSPYRIRFDDNSVENIRKIYSRSPLKACKALAGH